MLRVLFKDDYPFKPQIRNLIRQILIKHPLRENVLSLPDIESITINIKLKRDMQFQYSPPEIDYRKFPIITLYFGLNRYGDTNTKGFKRSLFRREMLHEFAHIIDSRDLAFGFTFEKKDTALKLEILKKVGFGILAHLWNCYIDGRLKRRGIYVKTWPQRCNEIGQRTRSSLGTKGVDAFKTVYHKDALTFDCLLSLQKRCLKNYVGH